MDMLIETIKSYVPVSLADEKIIRHLFRKKIIDKDEHVLEAGKICRNLSFLEQGLVRV